MAREHRYSVVLAEGFVADLRELKIHDSPAAAEIAALVQGIKQDDALLTKLAYGKFANAEDPEFDIKRFQALWETGKRIYRLKMLSYQSAARRLRLLYTFHPTELRYYFLAIAPREFNYDPSHQICRRIVDDYEALGIPDLP